MDRDEGREGEREIEVDVSPVVPVDVEEHLRQNEKLSALGLLADIRRSKEI